MLDKIKKTNAVNWLYNRTKDQWTGRVLTAVSVALGDLVFWLYRLWPPNARHNRRQAAILRAFESRSR